MCSTPRAVTCSTNGPGADTPTTSYPARVSRSAASICGFQPEWGPSSAWAKAIGSEAVGSGSPIPSYIFQNSGVTGTGGRGTGSIFSLGDVSSIAIGGSVIGGAGDDSAKIDVNAKAKCVRVQPLRARAAGGSRVF